jgi:hypothetical protein
MQLAVLDFHQQHRVVRSRASLRRTARVQDPDGPEAVALWHMRVAVDDGVAAGEAGGEPLVAAGRAPGDVDHPNPGPGGLHDALSRKQLAQRRLVHVPDHGLDGRADPLQLLEEGEGGQVAAVQNEIGRAQPFDAGVGKAPRPARQVGIGENGEKRRAVLTGFRSPG